MVIHVNISGIVQGVSYRAAAMKKAEELTLNGWVRNLEDGRVEAVIVGDEKDVKKMINWFWKGSLGSEVRDVEMKKINKTEEFSGFEIRY